MSRDGPGIHPIDAPERSAVFLRLPWTVYAAYPRWVPPLLRSVRRLLDRRRNPFWKHARARFWVARRGAEAVGRIAAILNPAHDEAWQERAGFFGFLETTDDRAVSRALLETAAGWLRGAGATVLRGPVNPSTNDECGVLIAGFGEPPFVMMPYTPPYYPAHLEAFGLAKSMDLHAFAFSPRTELPPKVERVARAVTVRQGIRLRPLNMKDFDAELERLRAIYNRAWAANWGFVPMTREEFAFAAADFKPVAMPEFILFAETDTGPVGAAVCVPNLNPLLKKMNGRLLPFGFRHLIGWRRKVGTVRLLTMGVLPEYQTRGVDALFYRQLLDTGRARGFTEESELGWVLETNAVMLNTIRRAGGRQSKTLRLYEMPL